MRLFSISWQQHYVLEKTHREQCTLKHSHYWDYVFYFWTLFNSFLFWQTSTSNLVNCFRIFHCEALKILDLKKKKIHYWFWVYFKIFQFTWRKKNDAIRNWWWKTKCRGKCLVEENETFNKIWNDKTIVKQKVIKQMIWKSRHLKKLRLINWTEDCCRW